MKTIKIISSLYDYSVEFIDGVPETLGHFGADTAYVIDANVYRLYEKLFAQIPPEHVYLMDAVEHRKNMDTIMDIITDWEKMGVHKNWKVVCFGGGITQDVTTMAANLYLRNIDWYFFPTTLLSMCDSCIGGKCGINLGQYKNQLGVFYPPKKIFIHTGFLDTLSEADYINGWGEILKFSLTTDPAFYQRLKGERRYIPCDNIESYIYQGLCVKKQIIEEDEFESDLRRVLNYGHTFGHALEAYTDNAVPHGKGVIWGIDVVNYIACKEGLVDTDTYLDIKALIKANFIREEIIIDDPKSLFEIIKTDKKVRGNTLNFAMPDSPGHLSVHPMEMDARLERLFYDYLGETHEYYND